MSALKSLQILIIFVVGSLMTLAKSVDITSASSFEGVVSGLCGHTLGIVSQVCIALYTFGTTIAFLVIIGDQLVDGKPYKSVIIIFG